MQIDENALEKGINDVGEAAFRAGYMKALKDVLDRTNVGQVSSVIAKIVLANVDKEQAEKFVKDHPFKFITK